MHWIYGYGCINYNIINELRVSEGICICVCIWFIYTGAVDIFEIDRSGRYS